MSGPEAPVKPGNTLKLRDMPPGISIYNIELAPGEGGSLCRAAGCVAQLLAKKDRYAQVGGPAGRAGQGGAGRGGWWWVQEGVPAGLRPLPSCVGALGCRVAAACPGPRPAGPPLPPATRRRCVCPRARCASSASCAAHRWAPSSPPAPCTLHPPPTTAPHPALLPSTPRACRRPSRPPPLAPQPPGASARPQAPGPRHLQKG
jgi:hypothetical protein